MTTINTNYANNTYTKAVQYEKAAKGAPAQSEPAAAAETEEPAAVFEKSEQSRGKEPVFSSPGLSFQSYGEAGAFVREQVSYYVEWQALNQEVASLSEGSVGANGRYSAEEIAAAKENISTGVLTADELASTFMDSVILIAQGDRNRLGFLRAAIKSGFAQSEAKYGGKFTGVVQETFDEIMSRLDAFEASLQEDYEGPEWKARVNMLVGRMSGDMLKAPEGYDSMSAYFDYLRNADPSVTGIQMGVVGQNHGYETDIVIENLNAAEKIPVETAKQPPEYHGGISTVWLGGDYSMISKRDGVFRIWSQEMHGDFYHQAFQFFRSEDDEERYWASYDAFSSSLALAQQELADQIAAGKGDSLDTLTAKVKIAPNMEMTLAEIQSVYEVCKKATDHVEACFQRSVQGEEFTSLHIMAAMSVRRGLIDAGLSQEIVDFVGDIYLDRATQVIDNHNSSKPTKGKIPVFDPAVHTGDKYYDYYFAQINYDIHDENSIDHDVYKKLTSIDMSSKEAFEKGFAEFYQWYHGQMELLVKLNPGWGTPDSRSAFLLKFKDLFF